MLWLWLCQKHHFISFLLLKQLSRSFLSISLMKEEEKKKKEEEKEEEEKEEKKKEEKKKKKKKWKWTHISPSPLQEGYILILNNNDNKFLDKESDTFDVLPVLLFSLLARKAKREHQQLAWLDHVSINVFTSSQDRIQVEINLAFGLCWLAGGSNIDLKKVSSCSVHLVYAYRLCWAHAFHSCEHLRLHFPISPTDIHSSQR